MAGCDRSVFPGCDQSSLLATSSPSFPAATGNLFMLPPRDKKRHPTRSDRQGGNVLGCTGRSARRLGTKKHHSTRSDRQGGNVLGVPGRSARRLGTKNRHYTRSDRQGGNVLDCTGRSARRLGTKNTILRVLTVKAATFWTVLAVLLATSGQKTPFYAFWLSRLHWDLRGKLYICLYGQKTGNMA